MEDCVFCKIIKKEAPAYIIEENDDVIVFLALEGHPLVVTKKHIPNLYSLDDVSGAAVMKAAVKVAKALKKSLQCQGVNLVQANEPAARQEVFHFHLHVKPRWENDSVVLDWDVTTKTAKELTTLQEAIKKAL